MLISDRNNTQYKNYKFGFERKYILKVRLLIEITSLRENNNKLRKFYTSKDIFHLATHAISSTYHISVSNFLERTLSIIAKIEINADAHD